MHPVNYLKRMGLTKGTTVPELTADLLSCLLFENPMMPPHYREPVCLVGWRHCFAIASNKAIGSPTVRHLHLASRAPNVVSRVQIGVMAEIFLLDVISDI